MGNAAVALSDVWAVLNNAAALSRLVHPEVLFAFQYPYGLEALQSFYLGGVLPTASAGHWAGSLMRFGDRHWNEHLLGLAWAHQIGMVSLGLKMSYFQRHIQDPSGVSSGTHAAFLFELGGVAQVLPSLFWGMHAYNLGRASIFSDYQREYLPVVLKTGFAYQPTEASLLSLELEKDVERPARIKAGFEYRLAKPFLLRTGVQTQPFTNSFGLGLQAKSLDFGYALWIHNPLGVVHHIGISYVISAR